MLARLFTAHPHSVNETYLEHARFASGISAQLFLAAGAALIHAVLPWCCERTASQRIAALYARTHGRGQ